jgi:hypothetical protein
MNPDRNCGSGWNHIRLTFAELAEKALVHAPPVPAQIAAHEYAAVLLAAPAGQRGRNCSRTPQPSVFPIGLW